MFEQLSMNTLLDGQSALVSRVDAEPSMRRRLLDIGLIPGTRVTCQGHSPAGDPAAYLIRGQSSRCGSRTPAAWRWSERTMPQAVGRAVLA
ncbi:MAG: FeoA family protein [Intestinimonas sp.]